MSDEPPHTSKRRLDFSRFHPLDHRLWDCRGYPGGWRTHLSYSWEYKWRPEVRRLTLCRLGRHSPGRTTAYRDGRPHHSWISCVHCQTSLSLTWREDRT